MTYKDPIITRLITLFNAEGPTTLRNRYYYGDPLQVNEAALPAVFISKDMTQVSGASLAETQRAQRYVINVVYDLKRDFGKAFNDIAAANSIYDLIEGCNVDYTLKSTSLAAILLKHQQLGTELWINLNTDLELDYGTTINKRGEGIFTAEGVLKLSIVHHQVRPS
ncbi:UNVERIFIED_ORG: hypothetical protein ABID57_000709 [Arthrobacter sp. UYEF1]